MVEEVIAASHGNKAHVYWRDFQRNRWVDFSDAQLYCKLMIFDRQGDYYVKITTEDQDRKVFQYLVPRDVQVIDTEGMFQFPVKDPRDPSGGKLIAVRFREPGDSDLFRMKVAAKIGGFSMPPVSGHRQAPAAAFSSVQPSPPQERKIIDYGPPQRAYKQPVQPSATHYSGGPPLPGPAHNVPYQPPAVAPGQQRRDGYAPAAAAVGQQRRDGYAPAAQLGLHPEDGRGMGTGPPYHQKQTHHYQQHGQYAELPRNELNGDLNTGNMPASRADAMVGMNQHQFYNQQQQQRDRAGLVEHDRYNPPSQPQPGLFGHGQQRGPSGGMAPGVTAGVRGMGPSPRKQNQQYGMDYRQPQQQPYLINPLDRESVQPQLRQQESQNNMAMQLVEAINAGDLDMAQRLTRSLTLENQRTLSQDGAPTSGMFSLTWEPSHKPITQKLHELEVVVESQKGERYPLYLKVKSDYTFGYLKSICDRQFRIPTLSQCWVVNEQVVSDSQTLADAGITGQGTVYVYVMHSVRAKIPEERVGNMRTSQSGQGQQQSSQQDHQPSQQDHQPSQQDHQPGVPVRMSPIPVPNLYRGNDPNNPGGYPAGGYPLEQSAMYRGATESDGHEDAVSPQRYPQEVGTVDVWAMPSHPANLLNNKHSPDPPNSPQMEVSRRDEQPQAQAPLPTASPQHQLAQILRQGPPPAFRQPEQPPPLPAPPAEKPQIGWKCSACTYVNKPYRPGCEMCDAARPNDYIPPPGYVPDESERKWVDDAKQQELLFQKMVEEENKRKERERVENYQRLMQAEDEPIVTNEEEFECPVCFVEIPPGDGLRLKSCLHMICKLCIKGSIMASEEVEIKCPSGMGCDEPVSEREMRAVLTAEEMQEVHMRGLRQAEAASANSFHCRTTDCPGFCFYEDEVNEYRCQNCDHINCLLCKAIHEDMNCQEYQEDLKRKADNDEAAKQTQQMLEGLVKDGEAMYCPGCKVIVTKKVGCDWIRCSVCKTEMCWATKGPRWGPKGRGDTTGGCRCGINGKRCIKTCRNCH